MDIILSAIGLLMLWPVLLAIGIAIKITSKGPALFKQRRYGLNGEEILDVEIGVVLAVGLQIIEHILDTLVSAKI